MVVRVAKATFLGPCNWCPESRQKNYIIGILLENVLEPFLNECHDVKSEDATLMTIRESGSSK